MALPLPTFVVPVYALPYLASLTPPARVQVLPLPWPQSPTAYRVSPVLRSAAALMVMSTVSSTALVHLRSTVLVLSAVALTSPISSHVVLPFASTLISRAVMAWPLVMVVVPVYALPFLASLTPPARVQVLPLPWPQSPTAYRVSPVLRSAVALKVMSAVLITGGVAVQVMAVSEADEPSQLTLPENSKPGWLAPGICEPLPLEKITR